MKKQVKPLAFQFYAKDWLTDIDVRALSYEEKGIYFELLCMSWVQPLPNDINKLAKILNIAEQSLSDILHFFFIEKDGYFYNEKLEKNRKEKIEYFRKMSEAGKKGNNKRWNTVKEKTKTRLSPSDRKAITKQSPSNRSNTNTNTNTNTDTDTDNISKDIQKSEPLQNQIEVIKEFGNPEINKMLGTIKALLQLEDFKETKAMQRNFGKLLVGLKNKIGQEEFKARFLVLGQDEFHLKNMGSLQYLYKQIKSYVPIQKDNSIKSFS